MPKVLQIPMNADILDELEEAFIDQKEDSHSFIWGLIRGLCRDAKMGKLNKACIISKVGLDRQLIKDSVKLKDEELKTLPSNTNWLPPKIDREDVAYYEHQVTDKTWKYLELYATFTELRHRKYSESVDKADEAEIKEMVARLENETSIEGKVNQRTALDGAKKRFAEEMKTRAEEVPTCIEQAVFNSVYGQIYQHVVGNIDKELDKENEEMYPVKKEEKSKK